MDDKQFSTNHFSLKVSANGSASIVAAPVLTETYTPIKEDNNPTNKQNGQEFKDINLNLEVPPQTEQTADKQEEQVPTTTPPLIEKIESKMVQEGNNQDGADEQMLGAEDNGNLTGKREEVKFIKGDHQNGDAKIDISTTNGKAFTGMTKEELMKYANDPFWVRLRWIFFVGFWLIWLAMLICAIFIIINAPKCAAPDPLKWYKRGLLAKTENFAPTAEDVAAVRKLRASGVIYELPSELTYSVREPETEQKIKNIINSYKESNVNVILDITPNYVTKDSQLMRNALADRSKRSAFIWSESSSVPNNWLSIVNGSAWSEVQPGNFVLSQFGDGLYDLHMNDTIVKKELSDILKHLIQLGVKGIRLKNSKFYLLSKNIQDEVPSNDPHYIHTQYQFWTHSQTTFQDGLGNVLDEYKFVVKNASDDAFLSVAEDVVRPEAYYTNNGSYGIDMPMYGRLTHVVSAPSGLNVKDELVNTLQTVGNTTWLQWNFADVSNKVNINPTAIELFMSLLPGVPVVPINRGDEFVNISSNIYQHIEHLRLSPSYMHGELTIHNTDDLITYSRIKSGNPGYLVIFNPTDEIKMGNFTGMNLPEKMTVDIFSDNFNVSGIAPKTKVGIDMFKVSPQSTIILTYVPVKTG